MNKILSVSLIVTILVLAGVVTQRQNDATASVIQTQEYNATTTDSVSAGFMQLKTSQGAIGSVVVASTTPATFRIWNATSTTDTASSSVTFFSPSPSQGTYVFDMVMDRGIIVELGTGFTGSYTVTYR